MSYRSLKRVLGETSLERKCLFLFGTCLLILITSGFWWYSSQSDELVLDATRRTAMGLKGTILMQRHLEKLTVPEDFETSEILYRELGDEATGNEWRFLRPDFPPDKQPLDETEAAMLARFIRPAPDDKGWDESRAAGEYRYFVPIKATGAKCVACHRNQPGQADLHAGDLMAVMEITIPDVGIEREQTKQRAILLANALVTVMISMVAVYFILHYVVFKPVGQG